MQWQWLRVFGVASFLSLAFACSFAPARPCVDGGQPAREKPWEGGRRCAQKKDKHGKFVNDGKYVEWFPSGQLSLEGEYEDGKKVGKWTEWDEKGRKIADRYYVKGVEVPPKEE